MATLNFGAHHPTVVRHLIKELDSASQKWAQALDAELERHWRLGRNLTLVWCRTASGVRVLLMPFELPGLLEGRTGAAVHNADTGEPNPGVDRLRELMSGSRLVDADRLNAVARSLRLRPTEIDLPGAADNPEVSALMDAIVRLYGINYLQSRAVALIDVVGFSLRAPLNQTTQLNALAHSINATHQLLLEAQMPVQFTRSTTGDGFYIWNHDPSPQGNIHLYLLLSLLLADNAIGRRRYEEGIAPRLKAGFHIGDGYEFIQQEALHPTLYSYIVGDITIELARMLEGARPDQILIGDFHCIGSPDADSRYGSVRDAQSFMGVLQGSLGKLRRIRLEEEAIRDIKCYLTGERLPKKDAFEATRFRITDKHHLHHYVYNAKLNIHLKAGPSIYLGLQHKNVVADPGG